ncbi:beta-lactamase family protein [Blastopirellula sp. JC732]|uniref:Beta-lactamase family protein n=1 Tax=Blastopirellula sediminis TaxID=2894196 RepID=A0A9X1MQH0_9BACT|nr:serine hydrolase [Blastopirellula sediminis]MCC9605806.1 beta-lactamase family protein [Blastopirellula sediminis]MCC9630894.1 beta-lactamase family protein [Blastopirellula sediminis]
MKRISPLVAFALVAFVSAGFALAQEKNLSTSALPRSTPEAEGVSSKGIQAFIEAADKDVNSMHSFMLVRHGKVVAEAWWVPEAAEKPHVLWSLSKSFTSTAVGLAIADGKLSLDDKVVKFFPDLTPEDASENLQAMTIRDLLTMSAGHHDELNWREQPHWAAAFLKHPVPHQPGSHFRYNTPATYMLSVIVQKVTGETVLEYLTPRLFQPLGIATPVWEKSPQGESIGGYGLYLKTEDIAKFGQLYLQKGNWNGKQILPAEWIAKATSKQVSNGDNPESDWNQGYGFQFWRCRHNAFRGDGKDGQFCIVMPDQDAVVAITAHTGNMQAELNVVWDHLLPALHEEALPADEKSLAELKATIANLKAKR